MSKPDEMLKNQCVKDMLQNVDNSVENALRYAYNLGYKNAKKEGAEGLFGDEKGCVVIDVQKCYGRYSLGRRGDDHLFVISCSEQYAKPGTSTKDIEDDTEKPLLGLVIHDAEHARTLANAFESFAKFIEDEDAVADDDDEEDEEEHSFNRKDLNELKSQLFDLLNTLDEIVSESEKDDGDGD